MRAIEAVGPRRTAWLLVALALAGGVASAVGFATAQDDAPVAVAVEGDDRIEPGGSATLSVRIDAETEVYGVEFTLGDDAEGVRFTGVSKGDYLSRDGGTLVVVSRATNATAEYGETRIGVDDGVTGPGVVANVTVAADEDVDAPEVAITVDELTVADPNATALEATATGHTVDVVGVDGPADPTATPTPTPDDSGDDGSGAGSGDGGSGGDSGGSSDAGSGGGSDDDSGGSGDDATATPTAAPTDPDWRSKVDAEVLTRAAADGRTPVVVQVRGGGNLTRIADRFAGLGLRDAATNEDLRVVTGTLSNDSLSRLASLETVDRIRYDGTAAGTATPTSAADDGATSTATDGEGDDGDDGAGGDGSAGEDGSGTDSGNGAADGNDGADGDDGAGGFGEASSDGTPTSTGTSSGSFPSSGLAPGFGVPALLAALGVLTALALWRRP